MSEKLGSLKAIFNIAADWYKKLNPKGNKQFLAFNPFSTDVKRRWTKAGWVDLIIGLQQRDITPIMMVAPNEVSKAEDYIAELGVESVLVQSHSPTQLAAIMKYIKFAVGPESGFVHLALAANSPHVIAFYNVLPPKATFPIDDPKHFAVIQDIPCAPCYLYKAKDVCPHDVLCMKSLSAKTVLDFIDLSVDSP